MASGDTLIAWDAMDYTPALSAALQATPVSRNDRMLLAFDASQTEFGDFVGTMPEHYDGGGVTVEIRWAAATATTGTVAWDAAFEVLADGGQDLDSDGFASVQTATEATSGTSGILTYTTIAFTDGAQMDSVAAGDAFRLRVDRDHDHASDNMTGDAQIQSVHIYET